MEKLRTLLEAEHSKRQKDLITAAILRKKIKVKDLIEIIRSNDGIYAQRGAYVITGITDEQPELLQPFIIDLWHSITPTSHDAIPRCVYRYLAMQGVPEAIEGEVFEAGCKAFIKKSTPIAINAHIMTILTTIALKYPELKDEVIFLIKEQLPDCPKSYAARARKELKRLAAR